MLISVFDKIENIVGKGENAGYQHFLLCPQCFQNASFLGVVKSRDCVVKSLIVSEHVIGWNYRLDQSRHQWQVPEMTFECKF